MGCAGELGQGEGIHVVERGGDQIAVPLEVGAQPGPDHPDVALVREHDALRHSGRAGGVEEHGRLALARGRGVERSGIDEAIEAVGAAELHAGEMLGHVGPARAVAEHQPRPGISQDEVDGGAGELEVHRHGDEARAHDAVIGRQILGAIGGKDGDAVAAGEAAGGERACDAVRHRVERPVGEFTGRLLAAEIDDRGLGGIAVVADEIAQVGEGGSHRRGHPFGGAVR